MMATFIHDEYLIAAISRQKELFDKSNKHYRDSEVKERIWESISTELNADVNAVKKRWKNLRDTFIKKKKEQRSKAAEGAKICKEWKYLQSMEFLAPYVEFTSLPCNASDNAEAEECHLVNVEDVTIHIPEVNETANSIVVVPDMKESIETSGFVLDSASTFNQGKKRKAFDGDAGYVREAKSRLQPGPTAEEHFALSLVPALRRMDDRKRAMAKLRIQQVMFEVEFDGD